MYLGGSYRAFVLDCYGKRDHSSICMRASTHCEELFFAPFGIFVFSSIITMGKQYATRRDYAIPLNLRFLALATSFDFYLLCYSSDFTLTECAVKHDVRYRFLDLGM